MIIIRFLKLNLMKKIIEIIRTFLKNDLHNEIEQNKFILKKIN